MRNWLKVLIGVICGMSGCLFWTGCKSMEERTRYEIVAEYRPSDAALAGTVKVDFLNTAEAELDCLKFNLYANAYRENALYTPVPQSAHDEAYYDGESYGEMMITSVLGSKNWEIGGADENILYAYLERPVYPGERVVLDVGFCTRLANVKHRTGVTPMAVNLGGCIPMLCALDNNTFIECVYEAVGDPFLSDCADVTAHITVPKDYVLASTGEEREEKTLESKKRHTIYATNVRDFAMVASNRLRFVEAETGKTRIKYYYFEDETPHQKLRLLQDVIAYYSSVFGEYPYATFSAVQTELCFAGMEYATLCMVSNRLMGEEQLRALAHEAAHQWWYAAVGSDQLSEAWQDEGLAEFSALLFFEKHEGYGVSAAQSFAECAEEYKAYRLAYEHALGWVDSRMSRPLGEYLSDYEYKCVAYDKSVLMFDSLRASIGEKKLLAGLRKYYAENKYKMAMPAHLIGAFERTGIHLNGFFEGYLQGKGTL